MRGNARVYKADKECKDIILRIPRKIVQAEKIRPGNRIDFDITNPHPEVVEEPTSGLYFQKKKESELSAQS
jgi:hypothetical protein